MKTVFKKVWETLSEPRFVTGLAVTLYAVTLGLGVYLLYGSGWSDHNFLIPGILLTLASTVALPSAWVGWRCPLAPELEKIFIPSVLAGLATASLLDFRGYPTVGFSSYVIDTAMLVALGFVGVARWIWLVSSREKVLSDQQEVLRRALKELEQDSVSG